MENSHEQLPKSKTQRKKEAHELQELGESLLHLTTQQLEEIPLPPHLRVALADAQRFKSHEAKRRQLQYIGKLMKNIEVEPIINAIAKIKASSLRQWQQAKKKSPSGPIK